MTQSLEPDKGPDLKRLLLFFMASMAVFTLWWRFAAPPMVPPVAVQPQPLVQTSPATVPPSPDPLAVPAESAATAPLTESQAAERITIRTPFAEVQLTNVGGRITSWKLLGHAEYGKADSPLEIVPRPRVEMAAGASAGSDERQADVRDDAAMLPLQVVTGDAALDSLLSKARHVASQEDAAGRHVITLRWSDGAGLSVEKTLTLRDDSHVATIEARLTRGGRPIPFHLAWGPGLGNHTAAERGNSYFRRGLVMWRSADKVFEASRPEDAATLAATSVDWVALEDSYYAVVFVPADENGGTERSSSVGHLLAGDLLPRPDGKPGKKDQWPESLVLDIAFTPEQPVQALYVGPLNRDELVRAGTSLGAGRRLETAADLGMLTPIALPMRTALLWFHVKTGSWGIAIVLLTLTIRFVIFPFTHYGLKKSRLFQDKMALIKPKFDALNDKFRKLPSSSENRVRKSEEQMELYRSVGMNPFDSMLGCIPMLMSMPFFFALYKILVQAAEFRNQGFLIWTDLSASDPWYVWPILTGLTMFISARMSASSLASLDPAQRALMLYMFPAFFTWVCLYAPLGLVVYWTVNNIVQMGQQKLLNIMLPPPVVAVAARAEKSARKR